MGSNDRRSMALQFNDYLIMALKFNAIAIFY